MDFSIVIYRSTSNMARLPFLNFLTACIATFLRSKLQMFNIELMVLLQMMISLAIELPVPVPS
jgi:hypothetical protein